MTQSLLPQEFLESVKPILGDSYPAFLDSYQRPHQRAVRLSGRRKQTFADYPGQAVPWQQGAFLIDQDSRMGAHPLHWAGAYYLQDASAMAAVAALSPCPGEKVLDLCAAPGGKASQIADDLKGQGLLVANEFVPKRAKELNRNLERMGVTNSLVLCEAPERISGFFPAYFDRVLVDAPCSGEGMFRKDPDSICQWSADLPAANAARQLSILEQAAKTLKPGGRMVYSTCTFNQIENEGVIEQFLSANPSFSMQPFALPGLPAAKEGMLRLWPHRHMGEGHFVALLQKSDTALPESAELYPGKNKGHDQRNQALLDAVNAALPAWVKESWQGNAVFQDQAVMVPEGLPDLHGLRIVRMGLHLGNLRGKTPVPDHALALAGTPCLQVPVALDTAHAYRQGHPLMCDPELSGFAAPSLEGWPLGWGKAVEGILKNHYPKGLRV